MNLLDVVCRKMNYSQIIVFVFAYHYAEIRINIDTARLLYKKYQKDNQLPNTVENYCLDILAKRTTVPQLFIQGGCKCFGKNT